MFVSNTLPSLKRTTDVMFGGKQVVVCGYGEVRSLFKRSGSLAQIAKTLIVTHCHAATHSPGTLERR